MLAQKSSSLTPKKSTNKRKTLCQKYGFEGIFPLDNEIDTKNKTPKEIGVCISAVNEELIRSCEVVIANLTPFRGPSADVGTVYEMGFAHAPGKKALGYTNVAAAFTERTIKALNSKVKRAKRRKIKRCKRHVH